MKGLGRHIPLILLTIAAAVVPLFVSNSYTLSILVMIGLRAFVTIGLSLLMGYTGQISIAQGAFFGLGAYGMAVTSRHLSFHPLAGIAAGVALAALVAFVVGRPTLKLHGHYLAMATLGLGEILFIVFNELSGITGGPSGMSGIPNLTLFGFTLEKDLHYYLLVWGTLLPVIWFSLAMVRTREGRAMRAIHDSEEAASSLGVNVASYKLRIFVISAALAAFAGGIYASWTTFISPSSFSINFSILAVIMVAVGGMGSLWGTLLGTAGLSLLPEYLHWFQDYDLFAYGSILLLVIVFLPMGIVPGGAALIRRLRAPKEART